MMTRSKLLLSIGISLGILVIGAQRQIPSIDTSNSARIVSNGIGMNGEAINHFTETHPSWIDRSTTQATVNEQTAEVMGANHGQLVFRLSK